MSEPSFDPRTWNALTEVSPNGSGGQSALPPAASSARSRPGEPARRGWLGLSLSAVILLAGAAAAFIMRPGEPAIGSSTITGTTSASR